MKIAISSQCMDLTSQVDARFGRAPYFIIFDTEKEEFTVINNQSNTEAAQGAGVRSAEKMAQNGVEAVISGNLGPKAIITLAGAGITTYAWSEGTVSQAINLYRDNKLTPAKQPTVDGHWT